MTHSMVIIIIKIYEFVVTQIWPCIVTTSQACIYRRHAIR